MSRYGGLRCPSEHLALKWEHVDWVAKRITIPGMKTKERTIPLFAELERYLKEAWEPEAEYVITRYRDTNANLRTQLLRILRRAGVPKWVRLFHNLRASRQTELENQFPTHVVCAWLGNSPQVARKHYLQVTDEHFAKRAAKSGAATARNGQQRPATRDAGSQKTPRKSLFPGLS